MLCVCVRVAQIIHLYIRTYIRCMYDFGYHTYGHIRCTYTFLANPSMHVCTVLVTIHRQTKQESWHTVIYGVHIHLWPTLVCTYVCAFRPTSQGRSSQGRSRPFHVVSVTVIQPRIHAMRVEKDRLVYLYVAHMGTMQEQPLNGTMQEQPLNGTMQEQPSNGTMQEQPLNGTKAPCKSNH